MPIFRVKCGMKQAHKDFLTKENCPSLRSVWGFTLATVPTCFACCDTAVTLSVLVEGTLKGPIGKVLIELGILWLVTVFAWMRAFRWLSKDSWFKESRKFTGSGLATSILAAPLYQFIRDWSRNMGSGIPLEFNADAAIVTAPFWGIIYFCMALIAASWSAILIGNLGKIRDDSW